MGKHRIQIDLGEVDYEILNRLKETSHHSTTSGVFNDALRLYNWFRNEETNGQVLLSVPKESDIRNNNRVREMVAL